MRNCISLFCVIAFAALCRAEAVVHVLTLDGVINPVATDFLEMAIDHAAEEQSECLIIQMDTPGGLMKSMQEIVKKILAAPVPVVVYVAPPGSRAGSAGVFITYAAHVAAMAPGTNIGAAHPVNLGMAPDSGQNAMMEKVTNDAVAFIRSIAEKRGRNMDWAEAAVRESASIPASEALKLGVIDVVAPNVDSLLAWMDGREYEVLSGKKTLHTRDATRVKIEMSWRFKILNVISDPNIAYILLLIGIYGIFFELYNPGVILPGVVGGICLILAFYAMHTLPVNYAGLLLILFALILFVAEIKVTSYGTLTIGGIVSFVLGSIMLFKTSLPFLQISWKLILFAVVITSLFFLVAVGFGVRAQRRRPVTGREGLVGETGRAVENFNQGSGQVDIHGEIWRAESSNKIRKGDEVEVVTLDRLKMTVRKK